jgi:hypothetical protein
MAHIFFRLDFSRRGRAARPKGTKGTKGRALLQTVGKHYTNTKFASVRAHKEQNTNLITLNQQNFEKLGDECAPCTRAARPKGTKGRALLQTVGEQCTNTKLASARAHKEQNKNDHVKSTKFRKNLETREEGGMGRSVFPLHADA